MQASDPTIRNPAAPKNSERRRRRFERKAVAVTTMAVTIIYPVTSHCAISAPMENSPMMLTRATLTMFSLNAATNALPYSTASMDILFD